MNEPVVRLRITLQDIEPAIWRRVDVPTWATLAALHGIIQTAMRWQDAHLYNPHPDYVAVALQRPV